MLCSTYIPANDPQIPPRDHRSNLGDAAVHRVGQRHAHAWRLDQLVRARAYVRKSISLFFTENLLEI